MLTIYAPGKWFYELRAFGHVTRSYVDAKDEATARAKIAARHGFTLDLKRCEPDAQRAD